MSNLFSAIWVSHQHWQVVRTRRSHGARLEANSAIWVDGVPVLVCTRLSKFRALRQCVLAVVKRYRHRCFLTGHNAGGLVHWGVEVNQRGDSYLHRSGVRSAVRVGCFNRHGVLTGSHGQARLCGDLASRRVDRQPVLSVFLGKGRTLRQTVLVLVNRLGFTRAQRRGSPARLISTGKWVNRNDYRLGVGRAVRVVDLDLNWVLARLGV